MIRLILFALSALAAGVVLGLGSLYAVTSQVGGFQGVRNGAWTLNPLAGSRAADPYTRLGVAMRGLLALNKSETIYFASVQDSAGDALRPDCLYRIEGGALPARWWSVTLYSDGYLTRNADAAHSIDMTRTPTAPDGRWTATLGGQRPENGAWISTTHARDMSILLRLYNPAPEAVAKPETVSVPTLTRMACEGGV